ncbi:MAG: FtsW/RodA/SpoVE family cell cycle protein [Phycisphaerae bacterium]|nr:FtsW/RodA/SpoVE family cell cycle protein [Phycisphaerae bacterium]
MLRPGQVVALCAFALLCIGVLMVNSADLMVARVDSGRDHSPELTLWGIVESRAATYLALACAALVLGALLPVRVVAERMRRFVTHRNALPFLGLAVLLVIAFCALVYAPGVRDPRNGAHRWIALPGMRDLSMQPSEVAKWALVPLVAMYCTLRSRELPRFFTGLMPAMIGVGAVAGFIVIEDLGTGVLVASVACLVLLAGGAKFLQFAIFGLIGAGGVLAAILTSPYRMNRVKSFLDPYAHPEGIGYHTIQGLIAIYNGGGVGRGLGEGIQKRGYLPEVRTDYIMALVCEEGGIAGAAAVMALIGGLVVAGVVIAKRERDTFLQLWALGITATVALQASMNLLVVTGMAPAKGIALPLVSYGGTGWILTAFSLGLLVSINRTQAEPQEAQEHVPAGLPA